MVRSFFSPEGEISMEYILLWMHLTFHCPPAATVQNDVCGKLINSVPIQWERCVTERYTGRRRKSDRRMEKTWQAEGAMDLHSLLRWSFWHLCRATCYMELLQELSGLSGKHTAHRHTHLAWRMKKRHIMFLCVCLCAQLPRLPWRVVTELKSLSHNIISLHLCGVDLNWMADYSEPALLSSPHEAYGAFIGTYGRPPACLSAHVCVCAYDESIWPLG